MKVTMTAQKLTGERVKKSDPRNIFLHYLCKGLSLFLMGIKEKAKVRLRSQRNCSCKTIRRRRSNFWTEVWTFLKKRYCLLDLISYKPTFLKSKEGKRERRIEYIRQRNQREKRQWRACVCFSLRWIVGDRHVGVNGYYDGASNQFPSLHFLKGGGIWVSFFRYSVIFNLPREINKNKTPFFLNKKRKSSDKFY